LAKKKFLERLTGVQRIVEVGFIISAVCAVYAMLALASFHPADPSWSQTAWEGPVHNAAGTAGAWLADMLLFSFGLFAYLVPPLIALLGWLCFWRPTPLLHIDYMVLGLKVIGLLLAVAGCAGLASINFDDFYYFTSGGVVGDVISGAMLPYFNVLGATLLLLCALACGLTLLTGLSWVTIAEQLGAWAILGLGWLVRRGGRQAEGATETPEPEMALPQHDAKAPIEVEVAAPARKGLLQRLKRSRTATEIEETPEKEPHDNLNRDPGLEAEMVRVEPHLPALSIAESDELPAEADLPWSVHASDEQDESFAYDDMELSPGTAGATAVKVKPQTMARASMVSDRPLADNPLEAKPLPPITPMPTLELLDRPDKKQNPVTQEELDQIGRLVEAKLLDFNVEAKVVAVFPGPVITRFELDLAPGVKVSKITNLSKDLARSLSAMSVRVVEVIPGKTYVGLELPNKHREVVYLSEVIDCEAFHKSKSPLTMVLGKDIAGQAVVVDLARMPHLLVAGTTGSGKSVGVNVMIVSLLYKSTPEEVRFIMIDPKMLELSVYEGIPHLLSEVVTDMKEAANALRWCVGEMERRYKLMSALGVRNLKGFNAKVGEAIEAGQPLLDPLWQPGDSMDETAPELEKLPSIVVVVDEFADMMMIVGKKVEELIARIAQKARAAGIHLILATQRPSVDVITGLIKANIPTRIAFQVSSKIDSRTILDQQGAEALLGQGDMLYLPPGTAIPTRVHGAFVDDHEVHRVVEDWCRRGKPNYIDEILSGETTADNLLPGEKPEIDEELDPLYDEAVEFVTESRRGSVSGVQRKFKIGYNRAARLVEQMEAQGVVSPPGHNGNRDVLAPPPPKD